LQHKQITAQQTLAKHLSSKKYLSSLIAWEHYLNLPPEKSTDSDIVDISVKQLADFRIWKVYQRVIKQGCLITEQSPDTALHDLRKTCKKLRYLIEFFQSLYSPLEIKLLIKNLKELQELLGDFQDCAVQESALKHFSEELQKTGCSEQTFAAIEKLVHVLDAKSYKARADFSGCFSIFANPENRSIFKALFLPTA
jgi:CHAD domain-containing protein